MDFGIEYSIHWVTSISVQTDFIKLFYQVTDIIK